MLMQWKRLRRERWKILRTRKCFCSSVVLRFWSHDAITLTSVRPWTPNCSRNFCKTQQKIEKKGSAGSRIVVGLSRSIAMYQQEPHEPENKKNVAHNNIQILFPSQYFIINQLTVYKLFFNSFAINNVGADFSFSQIYFSGYVYLIY